MPTPLIIMVGADKGGVGKTTVARALSDYLYRRHAAAKMFDTEFPAGDLKRFVPAADIIDIARVQDQMKVFDTLAGVTVVDVRAGLLSPTLAALDRARLLDDVRAGAIGLALLHVLGTSVSSLNEIADTAAVLGAGVKHFLVKNHISEGGFADWDNDSRFASHFRAMASATINVPTLAAPACDAVQKLGVSFSAFAGDAAQSRMLRGYVGNWLSTVWAEFDRVALGGLIDAAIAAG